MEKTYAQKCLDQINEYYADEKEVADRYRRNADNVWNDVIFSSEGFNNDATEKADPGYQSTIAVFIDGSELIWNEQTHEWEAE